MAPSALLFLAHGTEETEFVATYDVLVRAGVRVQSVLVGSSKQQQAQQAQAQGGGGASTAGPHDADLVTCSRGVRIAPDLRLPDLAGGKALEYDALIVPGGVEGAATISSNEDVTALLSAAYGKGRVIAAICAGTLAIKAAGIAKDSAITSHPSVKGELEGTYRYKEDRVVVAEKLITSRGPGTVFAFALAIVEALCGPEKRKEVEGPMVLPDKL